jgi:hypothetical protein
MTNLSLTPYVPHNNQSYNDEVTISIKNADFNNVNFVDGTITFSISECNFRKLTIKNLDVVQFEKIQVQFFLCAIEEIQIDNIESQNISVLFYSSILAGRITSKNLESISINNSFIRDRIFILNAQKINITYSKENLYAHRWRKFFNRIGIHLKEFIFSKQAYYINGAQFFYFSSNFKESSIIDLLDINLYISFLHSSEDLETEIKGAILTSLAISGSSSGKIAIEDSKISNWHISDFSSTQDVSFYNIVPPLKLMESSKISIHKSNLENVWFDNVYFDQYSLISFYRTKFYKTTFTSCNFPNEYKKFSNFKPIENVHYPSKDEAKENYPKDQYEIFLQLRKSLESTNNYYESQKIQSIAHEALRRIKTIPWWDKCILRINGCSNNHGLSIKRPFLWFVGLSVLFYVLYLFSLGRIFNSNDFDSTLVGAYFSFIDLTHRPDFLVEKGELTGWSMFLDFLNKVISGFLIYQFIAAFRKYGKS